MPATGPRLSLTARILDVFDVRDSLTSRVIALRLGGYNRRFVARRLRRMELEGMVIRTGQIDPPAPGGRPQVVWGLAMRHCGYCVEPVHQPLRHPAAGMHRSTQDAA